MASLWQLQLYRISNYTLDFGETLTVVVYLQLEKYLNYMLTKRCQLRGFFVTFGAWGILLQKRKYIYGASRAMEKHPNAVVLPV